MKNASHTTQTVISQELDRPYSREKAAYSASWSKEHKFWPTVGRIDNAYGDRNLVSVDHKVSFRDGKFAPAIAT